MPNYDIFTLVHPPYFRFMKNHLESIKLALNGRKVKMYVFSSETNENERKKLERILRNSGLDFVLKSTPAKSSIGASRNLMFAEGKAKYSIFLDADVIVNKDYFINLDKQIQKYPSVVGFAAGIGTSNCSRYGILEGAMDLKSYLRNLDLTKKEFNKIISEFSFSRLILGKENDFYKKAKTVLEKYEGVQTRAFQGFNQILKRKDLEEIGGFDENFWSAEDRELAIRLTLHGKKIIFTPSIWANHDYAFTFSDILKRKRIHGFWYGELKRKYSEESYLKMGFKEWREKIIHTFNPSQPFKGIRGRIYCIFSFLTYAIAFLLAEKLSINPTRAEKGGWVYGRDVN